jgi:3-hydroxyisobutyrate dehydrogenase-like beta-hydroxyacid dehydrogenase
MARVAFIGLGVMGAPMAGHLARAGHGVNLANRSMEKAFALAREGVGNAFDVAPSAVVDADFIFTCVGADSDVEQVFRDCLAAVKKGAVWVDHTTASAKLARQLSEEARANGFSFIDAPVSGGQAGAKNGTLTVMAGGDEVSFARVAPVMKAYAANMTLIGPAGSGQLAKMVNQICIAGLLQGLAEGLNFGVHAGLDMEKVLAAISKGAAQSWQMENRWKTMVAGEFDFGFAVDWMRKDLGLALDEAAENGARLDVAALVDRYYAEVQDMGGARWDTSSLIARLNK